MYEGLCIQIYPNISVRLLLQYNIDIGRLQDFGEFRSQRRQWSARRGLLVNATNILHIGFNGRYIKFFIILSVGRLYDYV